MEKKHGYTIINFVYICLEFIKKCKLCVLQIHVSSIVRLMQTRNTFYNYLPGFMVIFLLFFFLDFLHCSIKSNKVPFGYKMHLNFKFALIEKNNYEFDFGFIKCSQEKNYYLYFLITKTTTFCSYKNI